MAAPRSSRPPDRRVCACGRTATHTLRTTDTRAVPRRASIACGKCLDHERRWVGAAGPLTVHQLPGAAEQTALDLEGI